MSQRLVIYHGNCYDGVTAAWIAYKALDAAFEGGESNVEYLPLNYSDSPPNVKGKDVYILDFSFKREIMRRLAYDANVLVCLDHHKTAQEALEGLAKEILIETGKPIEIIFDMNRSGAGITWDYFFPDSPRRDLVNYIEDRDLWKFQLECSRIYNAWIQSFDIDLNTWINTVGPMFMTSVEILESGRSILRVQDKYVKQICFNAKLKKIGEYVAPYVQTAILMSEVCDYLIKNYPGNYPFAFYSFERKDGKFQYGLRSRSDFDVSIIAKSFGGGGHKNAAGFELDEPL